MSLLKAKDSGNILAIDIYSLDRLDPELFKRILASRLDSKRVVEIPLGAQTVRVIPFRFGCTSLAAAISIDVIKSENRRAGQPEVQCYVKLDGKWLRVPSGTTLTTRIGDRYVLNQSIFGVLSPDDLLPPPSKSVRLGST